ncbi:MAG: ectoine/hydroxyectoine ABC transporter substrate-binding protein EhuB [Mesorhizobium sp.]|nr:MAG: ectoine/hydroxyectoine ABC transporter substrate-binding protein EhuB [Mesorhizobium sp.]RWI62834.1 MAG: ectoine/hydroxyectoine ABC transporter substrate-binding protein EhuB [Mesorhizobium sp.]RWI81377.1 MAG: ectoine/hydroxyectoine ABC transporter substrate-binding protein EhuB [Mesorhizobium sp.]RWJ42141.1 MAG: ectoine/hydroxyectoine ABC transporter substrate-binding protein EhuB [Mesorhizobium sp.]RWJ56992.1 MAG: ectoine/hydroxyectoine ABC transporter substrate-binding protein EhuB [
MAAVCMAAVTMVSVVAPASAESLLEKIKSGETVRIGYSNDAPWAYSGGSNEPLGISNTVILAVLKRMGATKIEPVVTEWGSLIPGLQAGRFDIISDAMYVNPERCHNVLFTDPIATVTDSLVVPKDNPKGLHSLEDVRDKGMTLVTGSAFASLKNARDMGIADDKLMQVPGYAEIVQAVKAHRADVGAGDYLGLKKAISNDQSLELASPYTQSSKPGNPAFAFPLDEHAAVDAFNAAMKVYIGSDDMLASVSKYGYDKSMLPGSNKTADLCKE